MTSTRARQAIQHSESMAQPIFNKKKKTDVPQINKTKNESVSKNASDYTSFHHRTRCLEHPTKRLSKTTCTETIIPAVQQIPPSKGAKLKINFKKRQLDDAWNLMHDAEAIAPKTRADAWARRYHRMTLRTRNRPRRHNALSNPLSVSILMHTVHTPVSRSPLG